MSTLKAPALQNLKKREDFFKLNPTFPGCMEALNRISYIKKIKGIDANWKVHPKIVKSSTVDGAEFYKNMQKNKIKSQQKPSKDNPFKALLRMFNRGTK